MSYERDAYMRAQNAHHDMLRMRDPAKSIFARTPPIDRNPKGEDRNGLRAQHESDGAEGRRRN